MTGSELVDRYRAKALCWKEMVLLPKRVALAFLADCVREEIRLLGVDAFDPPVGDSICGPVGDSLDVSGRDFWDYSVSELCELAREFVEAFEDDARLFEMVVED